jgi:iron complex transport system substrate-binding protein
VTIPASLRRRVPAALLALLVAASLAGCGSGSEAADDRAGESTDAAGEPWSFTDDLGITHELPERPTRVAGLTDAVSSLWSYGIKPVAVFGFTAMSDDSSFDGKDTEGVVEVGRTYGEIDLEALAAADPDLVVTHAYPPDGTDEPLDPDMHLYGFADKTQQDAVEKIAPIVTIEMDGTADVVVGRTLDLAESLGVDPASSLVREAKADYEQAAARLSAAAEKGLTVMALAAYVDDGLYIAKAPDDPSLGYYASLGVDFPDPGGSDYYWQTATWEELGQYSTDVVLNSTRAMSVEEVLQQPTFAELSAAQAGQVFPWNSQNMDYVAQARNMNDLASWLEQSEKVTG